MRKAGKNLKLLILVIVPFALSGCTIIYYPFFRNYSNKPVELIFEVSDYYKERNHLVEYKKQILPVSRKTYKKLNDSLPVVMLSHNKASLTIPPGSTAFFPGWVIFQGGIIFLKQENRLDSISIFTNDGISKRFQYKRQGFPVATLYYYDYK